MGHKKKVSYRAGNFLQEFGLFFSLILAQGQLFQDCISHNFLF
jgi:hypothetical protein